MNKTLYGKSKIMIPTYPVGAPNLNPIIGDYRQEKPYPYKLYDVLSFQKEDVDYDTLVVENEYLKLTVIPKIGGRLYSAYDKRNGRELFYRNNVVKSQLVGLAGAWMAGGVEFNFPIGHRPTSMEEIEAIVRGNQDGSASIFVGETDKITGVRFSVEMRLEPGKAYFEEIVRIYNPTALPQRFFFWNTASYPDTEELVCRYPTRWLINEQLRQRKPWPYDGDVDVRWAKNIEKFASTFAALNEQDYFGVYDLATDCGNVHVANHREVPGSKFWSWGNHEHGKIWHSVMTDDDGPYMEHQAGNTETQNQYHYLLPYQKHNWREYWFQAIKTGPFTFANKHFAAATKFVQGEEGKLTLSLALQTNEVLNGATLKLIHSGTEVYVTTGNWSPMQTERREVELTSECLSEGTLRLQFRDAAGKLLADHLIRNCKEASEQIDEESEVPSQDDLTTQLVEIYKTEERLLFAKSIMMLDELLSTHPNYLEAHIRKAIIQVKMLNYASAEVTIEKAMGMTPFSDELLYYAGLIRFLIGKWNKAKNALLYVNDISVFAPMSNVILGKIELLQSEWYRAERYFAKALLDNPKVDTADVLQVYALRRLGEVGQAQHRVEAILEQDPLNLLAAAEYDQLNGTNLSKQIVRDDVQNALHILQFYEEIGDEAGQRFALDISDQPNHPLVLYHRGYLKAINGMEDEAVELYLQAERQSPDWIFPNLLLSLKAFEDAIRLLGDRARSALYYSGLIYYAKDRFVEVERVWSKCMESGFEYSVLFRNFGYMLIRTGDNERALGILEKGLELSPDNYDIMIYLNILYKNEGLTVKRAALLERIQNPDEMPQGPVRMVIDIYIDMQEYDKALNLLTSYPFSNWEIEFAGVSNLRDMFHRARIGKALKAMEAKKWDDAINDLEQSMIYPKNTQLGVVAGQNFISELYLLSICCEKKGDFTGALQYCNKIAALQLSANSPNYNEFIKAIHKKVELEWLGFE